MKQEEYRSCISKGLTGKKFDKEQRKLEFCIVSKLCSSKAKDRKEAEHLCSLPKEPKPPKLHSKGKGKSDEKKLAELAHCMADNIDMDQASNINSIEIAIANALMACGLNND